MFLGQRFVDVVIRLYFLRDKEIVKVLSSMNRSFFRVLSMSHCDTENHVKRTFVEKEKEIYQGEFNKLINMFE